MDINEALDYIHSVSWLGSVPGLERVSELLHRLGDPQKQIPVVHIAGTNGKGSTAMTLSNILTKAGYVTGLCTSPYIFKFNERMQCCGRQVTDEELCRLTEFIKPHADAMENPPTEFELVCAMTFLYFAWKKCDIAVVEVGMGGRLDATNIVEKPLCSVIMNIGLDHTRELGDTLEKIAAEKAGIIKPGCDAVMYYQTESVMDVVRRRCAETGSLLTITDPGQLEVLPGDVGRLEFIYRGEKYATPLLGVHQAKNAAVVLEIVDRLRIKGYSIPDEAVRAGLETVNWPARFEIIAKKPWFVVDGGHNPQCAETVADNIRRYFPDTRTVLLTGVLADKDYGALTDILDTVAHEYVTVTPQCPRALSAENYAKHLEKYGKPVTACGSIAEGVEKARALAGENGLVVAVGSLYMAGPIRDCFGLE
ncbi:MAG: bifunctional folylpolyglutamate synthase/dihydrofolate synthase [Candidatus Heteroscillospira sp.]|jgi:dihydrofolate synthase/folylpolyglutamate synthase